MNLFVTLFGGMLLTGMLYAVGRRLRLSNLWAATFAAALPSGLYIVLVAGDLPGLDRITMHLIAYPTVAILLAQLYGAKADHTRSLHWVPKLMIGFFLFISVVFGSMVYIAAHGLPPSVAAWVLPRAKEGNVHTGFAGVVEHRLEAAKGVRQHLKQEDRLARLGWRVTIDGLAAPAAGHPVQVSIALHNQLNEPLYDVGVRLSLGRPGKTPEIELPLTETGIGRYEGRLDRLEAGVWVAYLELSGRGEQIHMEHTLEVH